MNYNFSLSNWCDSRFTAVPETEACIYSCWFRTCTDAAMSPSIAVYIAASVQVGILHPTWVKSFNLKFLTCLMIICYRWRFLSAPSVGHSWISNRLKTGKKRDGLFLVNVLSLLYFSVNSVCFAPHELGLVLACGSSDGSISILSNTGKYSRREKCWICGQNCCVFSPKSFKSYWTYIPRSNIEIFLCAEAVSHLDCLYRRPVE